ncbi:hypothetical protein CH380_11235 [Leptospira adleri]|uniref:Uncharacterized protein n=1 Tax=Leptospira adleri TaxID=2023186 RepID=A0A2M9YN76_9LEPT|nr:hypothetical protein CH380_11235 [Leptospira adleri]PJZ60071.1 hypothetical protein CH376_20385 [Leptospira adleri]
MIQFFPKQIFDFKKNKFNPYKGKENKSEKGKDPRDFKIRSSGNYFSTTFVLFKLIRLDAKDFKISKLRIRLTKDHLKGINSILV